MKTRLLAPICLALPLGLGGCAELGATLITDARDAHSTARDYVVENVMLRREVRRRCWEIVSSQVDALRAEGQFEEAKDLLRKNYPSLVTVTLVKRAIEEPENISAKPFGCNRALPSLCRLAGPLGQAGGALFFCGDKKGPARRRGLSKHIEAQVSVSRN